MRMASPLVVSSKGVSAVICNNSRMGLSITRARLLPCLIKVLLMNGVHAEQGPHAFRIAVHGPADDRYEIAIAETALRHAFQDRRLRRGENLPRHFAQVPRKAGKISSEMRPLAIVVAATCRTSGRIRQLGHVDSRWNRLMPEIDMNGGRGCRIGPRHAMIGNHAVDFAGRELAIFILVPGRELPLDNADELLVCAFIGNGRANHKPTTQHVSK